MTTILTPETDPLTAPTAGDPDVVADARTAARTAAHELAAIEGSARTGELVTPAELVEARAAVELTRVGVEAAIRQHADAVEQARREGLAELAADMRAAEPPHLGPLQAAAVTAVRAYRDAAAEWTATVTGFGRRAAELDAPSVIARRADGYDAPVRRIGTDAEGNGAGAPIVDGTVYGWTRPPEQELARALDDGMTPGLPPRTPQPTREAA